jgi:CHAT domain-containing protein
VTLEQLRTALGGAALVELVRHGDVLAAVVLTEERCVLRRLGRATTAAESTLRLRHTLRRVGLSTTTPEQRVSARRAVEAAAWALTTQLIDPLAADLGDRPLVIVPTGALHTIPWAALPPLRGRPLCVASSAGTWLAAAPRLPPRRAAQNQAPIHNVATPPNAAAGQSPEVAAVAGQYAMGTAITEQSPTGTAVAGQPPTDTAITEQSPTGTAMAARSLMVTAVAGPGLSHAAAEIVEVSRIHRGAMRAPGAATVAEVLEALGGADVAHIAAHGRFCARSPLLSSLALDDGPLMAYDVLGLRRAPWLVVLSACDAGMAYAPVDGAPLGLPGAFLDRGSGCVVAGVIPVRDEDALALMTAFHTLLARGHTPADALATAGEETGVSGFACFGSLGHPLTY